MDYKQFEDRHNYASRQIEATTGKISWCKVSYRDADRYLEIICHDKAKRGDHTAIGPIACLGVRNGREVDLFRVALSGTWLRRWAVMHLERRWHGLNSRIPVAERVGRSDYRELSETSCIGVEINPLGRRSDVWVGTFDELSPEWEQKFGIVFSNAFDHAFEPASTAAAWRRVLRAGGYLILQFPDQQTSTPLDPVGLLTLDDARRLFQGELVYFRRHGSAWGYTEYVFRTSLVPEG